MIELVHVPYLKTPSTSTMSSPPTTTSRPTRPTWDGASCSASGHRGSSLDAKFSEAHIIAITAAIVSTAPPQGFNGPLFIGRDTAPW